MSFNRSIPTTDTGPPPAPRRVLQRKCSCGGDAAAGGECEECRKQKLQRFSTGEDRLAGAEAPRIVHEVLRAPGEPLDSDTRAGMEQHLGEDFGDVRVHTGAPAAASAEAVQAHAYTVGRHIVFGAGEYRPHTEAGRELLVHELAHTIQQRQADDVSGGIRIGAAGDALEAQAESVGGNPPGTTESANMPTASASVQRKVEMRDVGKGEYSGYAKLPDLIARLNTISSGLTFSMNGENLVYAEKEGGTLSEFDRQMKALIDGGAVLPLRLTNRQGLLGSHATGFNDQVDGDAWTSGYVDIDDLLAGSDLGLQSLLLHFLTERSVTKNYAKRIGTATFTNAEFTRAHGAGNEAEAKLLRDYFGDPTIKLVNDSPSPTIRRVFRNDRKVLFRRRIKIGKGADTGAGGSYIDVRTPDGKVHTPEEYLKILAAEKAAAAPAAAPVP